MKLKKISNLKIISKIITCIPIILFLLLIGVLIYVFATRCKNTIAHIDDSTSNFTVAIISAFVELIIVCGITAIPKSRKFIINLWYKLENKIYIFINNKFSNTWLKNNFINVYNSKYLFPYASQTKVINIFIENMKQNQNNLFYITGDNDSGKTTMLLLLFDECAKKIEYYKLLNKKAIYLCKSYNNMQIESFIDNYLIGKYKEKYIIIDDVGDFSLISQIQLWNKIILPIIKSNICYAKCITIISDKNNSFINTHINSEDVNNQIYIIDNSKSKKTPYSNWLKESNEFFKKYNIKDTSMKSIVNDIIKQRNKKIVEILFDDKSSSLKALFVCFIVLSRYSKIVDTKIVKTIYKKLGYNKWNYHKNIYILISSNLLVIFPFIKNFIYIDNQITAYFLNRYRNTNLYSEIINILKKYYEFVNDAEKWLVHCENCLLLDEEYSDYLFTNAFNMGNFKYLLENLNEILLINKKAKLNFYKELGYLNEKVGNRELAIENLKLHIKNSTKCVDKELSYLLLFEIEHHYNQDINEIEKITDSNIPFLSLQAKYWLQHIQIEKGIFNYHELFEIVKKYLKIEDKTGINYYHILRRMYSDLARVYYLSGEIDVKKFRTFKNSMENSGLNLHHTEYEDFYNLLTNAHYMHYDIIFQLGFYGNFIHDCDSEYGKNPNVSEMLDKAIQAYNNCETNFKKYGDKAWITISIRKNELMLCTKTQIIKILNELNDLRKVFISNNNDLHLAYIDCVLCKAVFLEYYINNLELNAKKTILKCKELLEESRKIYKEFDNVYGQYRIDLISTFLDFFVDLPKDTDKAQKDFKDKLKKMLNKKYYREFEIIRYILDMKSINTDLIFRFFSYYPIILQ